LNRAFTARVVSLGNQRWFTQLPLESCVPSLACLVRQTHQPPDSRPRRRRRRRL